MTEPTALSQLRHLYQNMVNGAVRDTASAKRIAEGLLAPAIEALERGTPPAVAKWAPEEISDGERGIRWVTNDGIHGRPTDHDVREYLKRTPTAHGCHCDECKQFYTTPQPTQTQAGAVPLTCEWTHNDDDGFWETACGDAWRFDDGGPKENNMNFCHCCGKSLRIKGKEAGNADA